MQFVDPQRDLDLRAEHNSRNARRAANIQTERYRSPDDRARILTAQRQLHGEITAQKLTRDAARAAAPPPRSAPAPSPTDAAAASAKRAELWRGGTKIVSPPKAPSPLVRPRRTRGAGLADRDAVGGALAGAGGAAAGDRRPARLHRGRAPPREAVVGVEAAAIEPQRRPPAVVGAGARRGRGGGYARPSGVLTCRLETGRLDTAQKSTKERKAPRPPRCATRSRGCASRRSASPSRRRRSRCRAAGRTWRCCCRRARRNGPSAPRSLRSRRERRRREAPPRGCASASPRWAARPRARRRGASGCSRAPSTPPRATGQQALRQQAHLPRVLLYVQRHAELLGLLGLRDAGYGRRVTEADLAAVAPKSPRGASASTTRRPSSPASRLRRAPTARCRPPSSPTPPSRRRCRRSAMAAAAAAARRRRRRAAPAAARASWRRRPASAPPRARRRPSRRARRRRRARGWRGRRRRRRRRRRRWCACPRGGRTPLLPTGDGEDTAREALFARMVGRDGDGALTVESAAKGLCALVSKVGGSAEGAAPWCAALLRRAFDAVEADRVVPKRAAFGASSSTSSATPSSSTCSNSPTRAPTAA